MAVATRAEGFTTLAGLVPAFAFHAVTSVAGLRLLQGSRKQGAPAAEEPAAA